MPLTMPMRPRTPPACICNAQQGTTLGGDGVTYVVQTEFSNAANNCVVQ